MIINNKSFFFYSLLFVFFSCLSFTNYNITANSFALDSNKQLLRLSGNVHIENEKYEFVCAHASMNTLSKFISINEPFKIKHHEQLIYGQSLAMDPDKSILSASNVVFQFYKYSISGKEVFLNSKEIDLKDVTITSCQMKKPMLYLKATKVIVYPQLGFLVALNSTMYLYDVPVLFFPAYFMGDRKYSTYANNTIVPDIGSNQVEGAYIKENLPYYINEKQNGTIQLGVLQNLGLKLGFQHYLTLAENGIFSSLGVYYTPRFWQGNFLISKSLVEIGQVDNNFLSNLFEDGQKKKSPLSLDVSYYLRQNELENFYFISIAPGYKATGTWEFLHDQNIDFSVDNAQIQENSLTTDIRTIYKISQVSHFNLTPFTFSNSFDYEKRYYKSGSSLELSESNTLLEFPLFFLSSGIGYEHIFTFSGQSPFFFDLYQIDDNDKLSLYEKVKIGPFNLQYSLMKMVAADSYYSRKYEISMPYERCIELEIFWEDVQKVFGFNIQV